MTGNYTHDFEIGVDYASIANLAALAIPVHYPKTAQAPYAGVKDLEDNTQRGMGLPTVTWHWTSITQAERDQLRIFCSGASQVVYIRTRTNDSGGSFHYYNAVMVWPSLEEEYDARTRQAFDIKFRSMILADPS